MKDGKISKLFSALFSKVYPAARILLLCSICMALLSGCKKEEVVVNALEEREANEIIVFLSSKGIEAHKLSAGKASGSMGDNSDVILWNISVDSSESKEAMAILNQNGLPRKRGTSLLELFSKQGLMSSEKEESIRYQAGLSEQIANTIRKIDGVIDADVQLSFPSNDNFLPQGAPPKITASVYVKHQGIFDDPNSHLVTKIKRLVSGGVHGLDVNDVTVISDRSRFSDINLSQTPDTITPKAKEYVSIWSIVLSKHSTARFRLLFFTLLTFTLSLSALLGWVIWKFYPILKKKGWKELLRPIPLNSGSDEKSPPSSS